MDQPLVGTREENYHFFYLASGSALCSVFILMIIVGYTAYISGSATELIKDMTIVTDDINELLPSGREALKIVRQMCLKENFTKRWGNICIEDVYHDHGDGSYHHHGDGIYHHH